MIDDGERDTPRDTMEAAPIFVREKISEGEMEATALNASSSERSGYEDDIYQATGVEYDYLVDNTNNNSNGYQGRFTGKSENFIGQSHNNVDDEEDVDDDDDNDEGEEEVDGQVDLNVEDYIIGGNSDPRDNREENAEQNMDLDGVVSTSSDYSD